LKLEPEGGSLKFRPHINDDAGRASGQTRRFGQAALQTSTSNFKVQTSNFKRQTSKFKLSSAREVQRAVRIDTL